RNELLKIRIGKNEFAATAKRNVSTFSVVELIPLSRFRSMSMVALPLFKSIFSRAPPPASAGLFPFPKSLEPASGGPKSKSNASMKPTSTIFILDPPNCLSADNKRRRKLQHLSYYGRTPRGRGVDEFESRHYATECKTSRSLPRC